MFLYSFAIHIYMCRENPLPKKRIVTSSMPELQLVGPDGIGPERIFKILFHALFLLVVFQGVRGILVVTNDYGRNFTISFPLCSSILQCML